VLAWFNFVKSTEEAMSASSSSFTFLPTIVPQRPLKFRPIWLVLVFLVFAFPSAGHVSLRVLEHVPKVAGVTITWTFPPEVPVFGLFPKPEAVMRIFRWINTPTASPAFVVLLFKCAVGF
jgi:hypothetical protein